MTIQRKAERAPISVQVAYRTPSAFLVSYSVNLSRGGIFVESQTPLPIGTRLSLSFTVPGEAALEIEGTVAWVRATADQGLPLGMGIEFEAALDERYGHVIDDLVRCYLGVTVLVVAASRDRLSLLGRYVRSIISCEIVEASDATVAAVAVEQQPDLAIVDMESVSLGLKAIAAAKPPGKPAVPVILLAGDAESRQKGMAAGADETLVTPPSFHDLQAAVIRMLSRPDAVRGL